MNKTSQWHNYNFNYPECHNKGISLLKKKKKNTLEKYKLIPKLKIKNLAWATSKLRTFLLKKMYLAKGILHYCKTVFQGAHLVLCKEKNHDYKRFCNYDKCILYWMKFRMHNMGMKEFFGVMESIFC